MESGLKRPRGHELCRRLHPNDSRNPFSFTVVPQGVMVWRRGRPKARDRVPRRGTTLRSHKNVDVLRLFLVTKNLGEKSDADSLFTDT